MQTRTVIKKNYYFDTQYEPHISMKDYNRRNIKIKKGD